MARVEFYHLTDSRGRPLYVAPELWRLPPQKAKATVKLPISICWSGRKSFDLASQSDRALAYQMILAEGTPEQIMEYIDGELLSEIWDDYMFPRHIREAWQPAIDKYRAAQTK